MNDTIKKAERTVAITVTAATATGAIPIPFADAPLLIGEQVAMMTAIAKIFDINIKEDGLKTLAAAAIGVGGATLVGKTIVSNALKFIPGAGWIIGGAISGATAGAITYGIGKAFIELCKAIQMGKMDEEDLTSESAISEFLEYFKEMVKNWKKDKPILVSDSQPINSDADFSDDDYDDEDDEDDEND